MKFNPKIGDKLKIKCNGNENYYQCIYQLFVYELSQKSTFKTVYESTIAEFSKKENAHEN